MIEELLTQTLGIGLEILRIILIFLMVCGGIAWVIGPILGIIFLCDSSGGGWGWKGFWVGLLIVLPTWILLTSLAVSLMDISGFGAWVFDGTSFEEYFRS